MTPYRKYTKFYNKYNGLSTFYILYNQGVCGCFLLGYVQFQLLDITGYDFPFVVEGDKPGQVGRSLDVTG